jgi:hypothetical protein
MFTPFDFSAPKNVLFTLLCNRLTKIKRRKHDSQRRLRSAMHEEEQP